MSSQLESPTTPFVLVGVSSTRAAEEAYRHLAPLEPCSLQYSCAFCSCCKLRFGYDFQLPTIGTCALGARPLDALPPVIPDKSLRVHRPETTTSASYPGLDTFADYGDHHIITQQPPPPRDDDAPRANERVISHAIPCLHPSCPGWEESSFIRENYCSTPYSHRTGSGRYSSWYCTANCRAVDKPPLSS